MAFIHITLLLALASLALSQRPFYAGSRPIGYPQLEVNTEGLGNRFGEGDNTTTTQRLPIEALGDRDLVDRLSKLPIDKQPFWLINWQALEANRQKPQTYPQRPSQFAQPFDQIPNSGGVNSNSASANPSLPISSTNSASTGSNSSSSRIIIDLSSSLGNRNGASADISSVDGNRSQKLANEITSIGPEAADPELKNEYFFSEDDSDEAIDNKNLNTFFNNKNGSTMGINFTTADGFTNSGNSLPGNRNTTTDSSYSPVNKNQDWAST